MGRVPQAEPPPDKPKLRQHFRQLRRDLPASVVARGSEAIAQALLRLLEPGALVGLYAAAGNEVRVERCLTLAAERYRWAFPRVLPERDNRMCFVQVARIPQHPGAYGIREPQDGPVVAPEALDAIVVPGVAFSLDGARLGMGAGFYDRYLARLRPDALRIGACFEAQLTADVPVDSHDISMTHIVTERRIVLAGDGLPRPLAARTEDS